MAQQSSVTILHLRYNGRSEELPLAELGLNGRASDAEIKEALAQHLDIASERLASHVVVRTRQAIVVRPEALYG